MTRSLTIAGLDTAAIALREAAGLPLLEADVLGHQLITDTLSQTFRERKGTIVLAPHGSGKTVALERDLRAFHDAEYERRAREAAYLPRRIVPLTTQRPDDVRDLFIALYRAAFDTPPVERIYRRQKQTEELRDELIARCREENVVAFVIDEAQTLTDAAFEGLRDLMAVSEATDVNRIERAADGTERIRPAGIGVMLLATFELQPRLAPLREYGRRWIRTEMVSAIDESAVPGLLARMLPAFAAGAQTLGEEAWAGLVQRTLTRGRPLPVGILTDVARRYICRASAELPAARKLVDLPWDEELFRQAAYENVGLQILGQEAA